MTFWLRQQRLRLQTTGRYCFVAETYRRLLFEFMGCKVIHVLLSNDHLTQMTV